MKNSNMTDLRKAQLKMLDMLITIDKICKKHNLTYWIDAGTLLGAVRHDGFIPWDDDLDICMPREDYAKFLEILPNTLPKEYTIESIESNFHNKMPWLRILYMKDFKCVLKSGTSHIGLCLDIFPMDLINPKACNSFILKLLTKVIRRTKRNSKKTFKNFIARIISLFNPLNIWLKYLLIINKSTKDLKYSYGIETGFCSSRYLFNKDYIFPVKDINFEGHKFKAPNKYKEYLTVEYGDYMELPPIEERVAHVSSLKYINTIKPGMGEIK